MRLLILFSRCSRLLRRIRSSPAALADDVGIYLNIFPGKGYSVAVPLDRTPTRLVHLGDAHVVVTPPAKGVRLAGTTELDPTATEDRHAAFRVSGSPQARALREFVIEERDGVSTDGGGERRPCGRRP